MTPVPATARPALEVADVISAYREDYVASRGGHLSAVEKRVMGDLVACRTEALGGHVEQCDRCGHQVIAYNSCRNRHCPKCQSLARAKWLAERQRELLPVEYFHVVFTVPHELTVLALQNKKVVYDILFRATAETLRDVAANPNRLGGEIGFLCILHTWGQNLQHHPHLHCVIPGGAMAKDRSRWIPCRPGFFLPVRVLGRLFRGKFLHHLKEAYRQGLLAFRGRVAHLKEDPAFNAYLASLYKMDWVVYSKAPFGGPEHVLKYLAGYTHRVAISNRRLVSMENGYVSFTWKDYANGCQRRVMRLRAVEFLRRFLLHVLPKGFVRIRHYGFLANRCRAKKLMLCQQLLGVPESEEIRKTSEDLMSSDALTCPACKRGTLSRVMTFQRGCAPKVRRPLLTIFDSS
jgi:hypothetical protein